MTGVAAIAFAATFTSCSKAGDLYDEGAIEKEKALSITEKYEAAFEKAFGKVVLTWIGDLVPKKLEHVLKAIMMITWGI